MAIFDYLRQRIMECVNVYVRLDSLTAQTFLMFHENLLLTPPLPSPPSPTAFTTIQCKYCHLSSDDHDSQPHISHMSRLSWKCITFFGYRRKIPDQICRGAVSRWANFAFAHSKNWRLPHLQSTIMADAPIHPQFRIRQDVTALDPVLVAICVRLHSLAANLLSSNSFSRRERRIAA